MACSNKLPAFSKLFACMHNAPNWFNSFDFLSVADMSSVIPRSIRSWSLFFPPSLIILSSIISVFAFACTTESMFTWKLIPERSISLFISPKYDWTRSLRSARNFAFFGSICSYFLVSVASGFSSGSPIENDYTFDSIIDLINLIYLFKFNNSNQIRFEC